MTRITRDRGALVHDDRLDALAMATAYWVEQISADADRAIKDRRDELLDITLEKFATNTLLKKDEEEYHQWIN